MYTEKRKSARMALNAGATLKQENQVIDGEVENVSLNGAFVAAAGRIDPEHPVAVTIHHTPVPPTLCDLKAKVVRVTEKGIGLEFEKSLLDE